MIRILTVAAIVLDSTVGVSPAFADCNLSTQELADCFPGSSGPDRYELSDEQIRNNDDPYYEERVEEGSISDRYESNDDNDDESGSGVQTAQ